MGLRACGVVVLSVAAGLWIVSGTQREKPVLAATAFEAVRALEATAAARPYDLWAARALAQAYLDARQPGLAVALLQAAPAAIKADLRVRHVYARALVDEGRNDEALAVEGQVIASCGPVVDAAPAPTGCDPVLLASAMRRADILRELVKMGVRDTLAHPEMSRIAYQNATRQARVTVQ